jgi:hypothetical protein
MHPHEVDVRLSELNRANTYKRAELLLIEFKNYSGKLTEDQLSRLCFAAITNEQIYNCFHCKSHLKVILKKNEENLDESQYNEVMEKIDG